jgi:hypothetical protein
MYPWWFHAPAAIEVRAEQQTGSSTQRLPDISYPLGGTTAGWAGNVSLPDRRPPPDALLSGPLRKGSGEFSVAKPLR